jgi:CubicO group peptidase (beta-lactamase class C family)
MSSGLAWDEASVPFGNPSNSYTVWEHAPEPYRYVLERPLVAQPGERFNYNSGIVALLGAILNKVSRRPLESFTKEALFDPLGIVDAGSTSRLFHA